VIYEYNSNRGIYHLKYLIVFSHPAPYKVKLFNGLAKHIDLTVIFERKLGEFAQKQYNQNPPFLFKCIFLKGYKIGKKNHLSFSVINHLKKNHYDYIIMNGYSSLTEMLTIHYLIQNKIPYYLYINGGVKRKDNFLKYHLKKFFVSHAQRYLSPSHEADEYLLHYGAKQEFIDYYPYSTIDQVDVLTKPLPLKEKQSLRLANGLTDAVHLVSVGQFIDRKNFSTLIQLWTNVPKDYHLVIIGEGPEERKYRQLIKSHRLTNVHIRPFEAQHILLTTLQMMDGFILLSKEDIYGHVINEALSQGLPVLTTPKVISGRTLIKDNINGFLISLNQLEQFPTKLEKLLSLDNPNASLEIARQNTIQDMISVHLEIFQSWQKN
jgi:glycosyltransferase involved in cell wall biosynthesis